ncbi:glutathione hydrolase 7-like [Aplochiton taeniatus]
MFRRLTNLFFGQDEETPTNPGTAKSGELVDDEWLLVPHQDLVTKIHPEAGSEVSTVEDRAAELANSSTNEESESGIETRMSELSVQRNSIPSRVTRDFVSQVGALVKVTQIARVQRAQALSDRHHLGRNCIQHHCRLPEEVHLKRLVACSPAFDDPVHLSLKETDKDPLAWGPSKCGSCQGGIWPICAAAFTFAVGITIALVMHNYLGCSPVKQGMLLTLKEHCTVLGQKVLQNQGSSVDAAIVASLCLGIVHPHTSGIGGGGVMLVHDLSKNKSTVINFQETAPSSIKEQMLQNKSGHKPGLLVGVPGMLRGLHQAHELYGRLSWKELVTQAAAVARDGFNVSHSLANASSRLMGQNVSRRFKDMFLPGGDALLPGSFLRMPHLAEVLEAGLSEFYSGNLSLEIANEVKLNGGVLSSEDLSHYSAIVEQPLKGFYEGFGVLVPPPPSIGVALISVLNILEGFKFNFSSNSINHWIVESLKAALAMTSGLGDNKFDLSSKSELVTKMLSKKQATVLRKLINDSHASPADHYATVYPLQCEAVASQVVVIGPDELIVSVASSLNSPFGSKILTRSGILLNSHMLGFSWSNNAQGTSKDNLRNRIEPGKRPISFLMPTIVIPSQGKCGMYLALSSSDGDSSLSGITQVVLNASSYNKYGNLSAALWRADLQHEKKRLLVGSEITEEAVQVLRKKGHIVQRLEGQLPVLLGVQQTDDIIREVTTPHSSDRFP